jgi:hypothetical protein
MGATLNPICARPALAPLPPTGGSLPIKELHTNKGINFRIEWGTRGRIFLSPDREKKICPCCVEKLENRDAKKKTALDVIRAAAASASPPRASASLTPLWCKAQCEAEEEIGSP